MSASSGRSAIVVGGGISGLSAAYYLTRAGLPVTLVEKEPRLGGVLETDCVEGCTLELGPDSFLTAKPWALDLIRELGLADGIIASNDHLRKSYILRRGRLVPLPDGLMMVVPTKVLPLLASPLLGWGTKMRMGVEWFRRPRAMSADRSVAEFLRDHYGQESVDYLGEPLLSGVYGGDPEQLSVVSVLPRFAEMEARYGSLTRGVLTARGKGPRSSAPLFQSLKGGLASLAGAIVLAAGERLTVTHGAVEAVERAGDDGWRVRVEGEWRETGHVVLACRAYQSAELLRPLAPELAGLLSAIPYTSSMTLALGYRRADVRHPLNGFGFLVPKAERGLLLGCTWVGTKFPHRVPEDKAVLRCFMAGDSLDLGDAEVVSTARAEIRRIMGVDAAPIFARIARWPRSMAQYTVGHAARVERMEALAAGLGGLQLAGSGYHGIGIPDCIRGGKLAAEGIAAATI